MLAIDLDARLVVDALYLVGHAGDLVCHLVHVASHETLDGVNGTRRVGDSLTLGGLAHLTLAAIDEAYDRWGRVATLRVCNYGGGVTLHDGYTRVGGAEVNTNNLSHSSIFYLIVNNRFCGPA